MKMDAECNSFVVLQTSLGSLSHGLLKAGS